MLNSPLYVKRTLSDGKKINVGTLAENSSGCYFQYDAEYLAQYDNLSPFTLGFNSELQKAPRQPHYGVHGIFGDSLPDGWGLYLMDRVFRQNGIAPGTVSVLERLAYVGDRCSGSLSFEPHSHENEHNPKSTVIELGKEAIKEFEGDESQMIAQLATGAGSGGARPKLNITINNNLITTDISASGEKWLVKFTSEKFDLGHNESLVEAAYMEMAKDAQIEVPEFKLINVGDGTHWLRQKRFDYTEQGKVHMHSACGLLDASFREPSLDYVELIKVANMLCGTGAAKAVLDRALFNFLTVNQDDHTKNWAFLCDDNGTWQLSPFYDIVYSPSPYKQHMMSFNGEGNTISAKTLNILAKHAGYKSSKYIQQRLETLYEITAQFNRYAKNYDIPISITKEISSAINDKYKLLAHP